MGHTSIMEKLHPNKFENEGLWLGERVVRIRKPNEEKVSPLVSQIDIAVLDFQAKLFNGSPINSHNVFHSQVEKALIKSEFPNGQKLSAYVEAFKLNLFQNLLVQSRQRNFTSKSIESYQKLSGLVFSCLEIFNSYDPLSPNKQKIAMIGMLMEKIDELGRNENINPKQEALTLIAILEEIQQKTKGKYSPKFFGDTWSKSIGAILADEKYINIKLAANSTKKLQQEQLNSDTTVSNLSRLVTVQ
jgi:hypothetical protein